MASLSPRRASMIGAAAILALAVTTPGLASYGYYVGKNLTADGSVLIGGTGEEVSGHWLEIVPRKTWPKDATVTVGVTQQADMPGELIKIPQVPETYKYITMNYSDFLGLPAPLTNGGLNEFQVAVRDIWSNSRDELMAMTPRPQHGLNYSDEARIVLERAKTAREGARIIGDLIDRYGEATYGGNSHLIADTNEGWVVLEFAGGHGLWVAQRLGPNDVRVSYPGYIGDIPADYRTNPDFMGSANLISFAVAQGWYDPKSGKPFNVHDVYGQQGKPMKSGSKYWAAEDIERELRAAAPVTLTRMMQMVRDPRIADDQAGYGQVTALRAGLRPELATLWIAPTGSITAPFIPWKIGQSAVPLEFGQHRYLYRDSGSTFLNPQFEVQEGTEFAGQLFKRLLYQTCSKPQVFLPEVTTAMEAFEADERARDPTVDATAEVLYRAGRRDLAETYLNTVGFAKARAELDLGHALLASIEARNRLEFYHDNAKGGTINKGPGITVTCLIGHDPDKAGS